MVVSLRDKTANVRYYGLDFDNDGECKTTPKIAESLIASGVLVEVKTVKVAS